MKRTLLASVLVLSAVTQAADETVIRINPTLRGPAVNPRMYGVFLEEINTAVDGGLYAEMIRNRGFEEAKPPEGFKFQRGRWVNDGGYATTFDFQADKDLPYWHLATGQDAQATLTLDLTDGVTPASPRTGKLVIASAGQGVSLSNEGYWGVGATSGESYTLSLWLKSDAPYAGSITASLQRADGTAVSQRITLTGNIDGQWRQYTAKLTATETDSSARLILTASAAGTLYFDMVSLFPEKTFKDRPNGMRQDIAQLIADLKPGFARFPGGCVVEGATIESAYDWKKTLGPIEQREEIWNVWDYRRTHGMGYLEYLQFIEDIKAEPMFVASAGQMCVFRNHTHAVPMDKMQPLVDSFIDAIEYANGDASTTWGRRRIEAGREKPFNMKMLEIGNENVGKQYLDRYSFIYPQIKAKYPDALLLACIPHPEQKVEMVDEHYYSSPQWFINNAGMYDNRDRKGPPVYIAEVAVTTDEGGKDRGNLQAALAEGVYLMGCERNSDVVQMVSYAPLLANVHGRTPLAGAPPAWHGMIYFDSTRAYGTASYHLWKLYGNNVPSYTVQTAVESEKDKGPISGGIGLGTWGTTAEFKDVKIEKAGGEVLFESDFTKQAADWKPDTEKWTVQDGVYRQSEPAISFSRFGSENWSDYTLSLKARKLSGPEGFVIMFGSRGTDRLWWNLGGWGNTQHAVELNQSLVGKPVAGKIETGRWYDIKIELRGREVKCYLDGTLVHSAAVPVTRSLHSVAGVDEATGDLVLKVINTATSATTATLDLPAGAYRTTEPTVTQLTSGRGIDNNSLDEPLKVVPKTVSMQPLEKGTRHTFPPMSLSILRFKK